MLGLGYLPSWHTAWFETCLTFSDQDTINHVDTLWSNIIYVSRAGPARWSETSTLGRGGGVSTPPPLLTRLPSIIVQRGKKHHSSSIGKSFRKDSGRFSLRSILRLLEVIKGQILAKFNIFPETSHYLRNCYRCEVVRER